MVRNIILQIFMTGFMQVTKSGISQLICMLITWFCIHSKAQNLLHLGEKRSLKSNHYMWRYLRSKLKVKNKSIEHIYSATSDWIPAILGLLDRSWSPLSNEYKFICLACIQVKLFTILSWQLYFDFLILIIFNNII